MKLPTNPSQIVLDAHYGYIYRITNTLTGFVYIGKHRHTTGERWRSYLGSGFRIRDEQTFLGRDFFSKELVAWTSSDTDAHLKELVHICALVQSGARHYNISNHDGALFATTPEQTKSMMASRLSHEGWNLLNPTRSRLQELVRTGLEGHELAAEQLFIVHEAIELKATRERLRRDILAGRIAPPLHGSRRSTNYPRTY